MRLIDRATLLLDGRGCSLGGLTENRPNRRMELGMMPILFRAYRSLSHYKVYQVCHIMSK